MNTKKTEDSKPINKLRRKDLIQIMGGCTSNAAGESDGAGVNRNQRA